VGYTPGRPDRAQDDEQAPADTNTHAETAKAPGGELDRADLAAAAFAIDHYLKTVAQAPASLWRTRERLQRVITAPSHARRSCDCDATRSKAMTELVGWRWVADVLGRGQRWIYRHRAELGGRMVGNSMGYDPTAVLAVRDRLTTEEGG
jgi:hypothetical protein